MNVVDLTAIGGPDPRIVSALIAISKKTRAILGLRLAEIGLMTGEDDVLIALADRKAVSVSEVARTLGVRFPTTLKVIDDLIDRGYIDRLTGPMIMISDKGSDHLPMITKLRMKIARDLLAILGAERIERLAADLEELNKGLGSTITPSSI